MADLSLVRRLTGWPPEVPDELLYAHQDEAGRELVRRTGMAAPASDQQGLWDVALAWLTAASAVGSLNAFSLKGAAKVGRLEGAVEFRFLDPAEVAALASDWRGRAGTIIAQIVGEPAAIATEGEADVGAIWAAAI